MQDHAKATRERLLDAAEDLFAWQGFAAVTVREIAAAAGVNLAAVNYHFQGKENLYREVLVRAVARKHDRYMAELQAARRRHPGDLRALVAVFFRAHFEDTLKTDHGRNFLQLLVREIHHGDPETARLVADSLMPMWADLGQAMLAETPDLDPDVAHWLIGSLHGQLVHFTMRWLKCRPGADGLDDGATRNPLAGLLPPLAEDVDSYIDRAVDHITTFSVAGIEAVLARTRPTTEGDRP